jgi:hypothetical protein
MMTPFNVVDWAAYLTSVFIQGWVFTFSRRQRSPSYRSRLHRQSFIGYANEVKAVLRYNEPESAWPPRSHPVKKHIGQVL